ncbi:MAG TPA: amino acid adenylation domain-containing protein [Pyrinomonadaceae bacterium]
MKTGNIEDIYRLSPAQHGILFEELAAPSEGRYTVQILLTFAGTIDQRVLGQALDLLLQRHPVLRTSFHWQRSPQPLQVVNRNVAHVPWNYFDWQALPTSDIGARLAEHLAEDSRRGFKLTEAPLFRSALFRTGREEWKLLFSYHHLLLDGWSLPILLGEIIANYGALAQETEPDFTPPPRVYRDYIAWLLQKDPTAAENYWREYLRGFDSPTSLPLMSSVQLDVPAFADRRVRKDLWLADDVTAKLNALARTYQVTLNTVVQGAWALLLARYSNVNEVVFGETVSGRPPELNGSEQMLGLFINTLPVRVQISRNARVCDWLRALQDRTTEARQYEYSPLSQVQQWSDVGSGQSLFDSLLAFENYPIDTQLRQATPMNASLRVVRVDSFERTSFGLTLAVVPGKRLGLRFAGDAVKFESHALERIAAQFELLLGAMAGFPELRLAELPNLTVEEQQLLDSWNKTQREYGKQLFAHEMFERHAALRPDHVAVVWNHGQLTYGELDARANRLARYLQSGGVGPESRVRILFGRTGEMIVSMIAVMKAGAAYVPLDPEYPRERISQALVDSSAKVVLTESAFVDRLNDDVNVRIVCIDVEREQIESESEQRLRLQVDPDNLAYVIYTSGSTGTPKGVAVQHRALSNLLSWHHKRYEIGAADRLTNTAGHAFDASLWEIWPSLTGGATLYLIGAERASETELLQFLKNNKITNCFVPTPLAEKLLPLAEASVEQLYVRHFSAGGDALRYRPQVSRPFVFDNVYGPTECTVASVVATIDHAEAKRVPAIGRPIANTQIHILDAGLNSIPIGAAGELYIGGEGVARGYLDHPAETAERFVPDPFTTIAGSRMYKTGDIGRWLETGELEFICRIDDQVKIRGQRVEPREIEVALCRHPQVAQAEILAHAFGDSEKVLVAYVVAKPGCEIPATSELRGHLRTTLPEYMVPALFVALDQMPLTANGKIDRRSLPLPRDLRERVRESELPLRTPIEEILAGIWSELLRVDKVFARDNFFELGGNSLLAIQLASRVEQAFNLPLPLRTILEAPTLTELASYIGPQASSPAYLATPISPTPHPALLPLSFAQQRIWSAEQLESRALYNITTAAQLNGRLQFDAFERAVEEIVSRHEALRTCFKFDGRFVMQSISEMLAFKIAFVDLSGVDETRRPDLLENHIRKEGKLAFDLSSASLFRVLLFKLEDYQHVALLITHHIVSDAWSMGVVLSELATLYSAYVDDQPSPFTTAPLQYADFALWQQRRLTGEVLESQLNYWRRQLSDLPPVLNFAIDRIRPERMSFRGARETFSLSQALAAKLGTLSRRIGATVFMTALAAFKAVVQRRSGYNDVIVGTPFAGRDHLQTEGIVGCFIKTLPLRTDLSGDPTFRELIKGVRDTMLGAHAHADAPFERLVEARANTFQITFGMQNVPLRSIDVSDLTIVPIGVDDETARFDLTVWLVETKEGLESTWTYNTDLFNAETIKGFYSQYERLLTVAVDQPDSRISSFELESEAERNAKKEEFALLSRTRFKTTKPKLVSIS